MHEMWGVMLFQNYGLFWHLDRVVWGEPGIKGELWGYRTIADGDVDFRYQRGIYALYDEAFSLVYVGQAGYNDNARLYDRLNNHRKDHLAERWKRFSWFGMDPVKGRKEYKQVVETEHSGCDLPTMLNHIEGALIAVAEPRLNLQKGRFGAAQQFYQRDWTDGSPRDQLNEFGRKLDEIKSLLATKK
jgi:hypothetical protein